MRPRAVALDVVGTLSVDPVRADAYRPAGTRGSTADDDETGTSGRVPAVELVGPDEFAERVADPEAVVVNVHVPGQPESLAGPLRRGGGEAQLL
jgi:hypothetical protein